MAQKSVRLTKIKASPPIDLTDRHIDHKEKDDTNSALKKYAASLNDVLNNIDEQELLTFVGLMRSAQQNQSTVFTVGNGGSASTASHWATDLGKGLHHRSNMGVKAFSLSDNMPWISAAANDLRYESIFSDQLRAHGRKGDLLVLISASGNSGNIIEAIQQAKSMGITTLSIVGFDGGEAKTISDYTVHIPTANGHYSIVEDIQLILNHFLCDYLVGDIK